MNSKNVQNVSEVLKSVENYFNNGSGASPEGNRVMNLPKGEKIKTLSVGGSGISEIGLRVIEY
ncbi:MAG: hypothetical protein COB14_06445 [Alphaproteobacteria bacterium]|nr:MAG: hypothetical protein COB14_06445 [Alphaproteobacteria bacterium]